MFSLSVGYRWIQPPHNKCDTWQSKVMFPYNTNVILIKNTLRKPSTIGSTGYQLVKASVGQADVQRFEPHLGHN